MNQWLFFLLVAIFVLLIMGFYFYLLRRLKKLSFSDQRHIQIHWYKVLDNFENDPVRAVLDADKILDFALFRFGKRGSIGEKLKKSESLFSDINSVWSAHKYRNKLAHELGDINKVEAKRALKNFKKALKDLGANI